MSEPTREELELAGAAVVELNNRRYNASFQDWLFEMVETQDEAEQKQLQFPDKPYLRDLIWALTHENALVFPKSRRMMLSWTLSAYVLHRIRYQQHNAVYWQSLTESKAAYMVDQRIKIIEDNIDPLYRRGYDALKTKTGMVGKLTFKNTGSYVLAIPQGDDVIRSFTPSMLIMDESDFQPEAHAALTAALPTLEKKSQIVLITTSNGPGHPVADICKAAGFMKWSDYSGKSRVAMDGYEILSPIKSAAGWTIVPVHYTHDPDKQSPEWIEKNRDLYDRPEDADKELEMDFTSQLGKAAYPSFAFGVHVRDRIKLNPTLPIALACDFNLDPCIFVVCQIRGGLLFAIDEICKSPATIPEMISEFRNRYPDHPAGIHIYGDSNGLRQNAQTGKSDYDLMRVHLTGYPSEVVMKVPRAHPVPKDRINSLNHKLKGLHDKPTFYVAKACVELIDDFKEVVMKPDGKDVLKIYRSDNPYSQRTHASDAIGYLTFREWPVAREALRLKPKKRRAPMVYGTLLGGMPE